MAEVIKAKEATTEGNQPSQDRPSWRQLSNNDIKNLVDIADTIHPSLPESAEVFAERVKLFPEGCLGLFQDSDLLCGYAISHPIKRLQPPALNSLLENIVPDADQYYIHDLAILTEHRGAGLAQEGVEKLLAIAGQYPTTCLISVCGTAEFWSRFGFAPGRIEGALEGKVLDYGDDAVYLERKN